MSEFKGTPGPWEIDTDSSDVGNSWRYIVGPVTIMAGSHSSDYTVATANAHLVAAAPDLLEALIPTTKLAMWTESADDDELVIMSVGTVRRMRAAIAKALGETK